MWGIFTDVSAQELFLQFSLLIHTSKSSKLKVVTSYVGNVGMTGMSVFIFVRQNSRRGVVFRILLFSEGKGEGERSRIRIVHSITRKGERNDTNSIRKKIWVKRYYFGNDYSRRGRRRKRISSSDTNIRIRKKKETERVVVFRIRQ